MSAENQITPGSALQAAAHNGDLFTVRHLIREEVDVNISDKWGRTALSLAAGGGHRELVSTLLQAGAWIDPHEDYDTRETPLIAAAGNGHLDIVKSLIVGGANPSIHAGVFQATAEYYARTNGHREISEYLLKIMEDGKPS